MTTVLSKSFDPAAQARSFRFVVLALRSMMSEACDRHPPGSPGIWDVLESAAPGDAGERLFGCFFQLARSLMLQASPAFQTRSFCARLGREEWRVVSMIEAAQCGDAARLVDAARELVDEETVGDLLSSTQSLAEALVDCDLRLDSHASRRSGFAHERAGAVT